MSEKFNSGIVMYSTSWCPDCVRAKAVMRRLKVPFTEIDIDRDQAGYQIVLGHNGGSRVVPTIFFPDGSALVEPSNQSLMEKLLSLGLIVED